MHKTSLSRLQAISLSIFKSLLAWCLDVHVTPVRYKMQQQGFIPPEKTLDRQEEES